MKRPFFTQLLLSSRFKYCASITLHLTALKIIDFNDDDYVLKQAVTCSINLKYPFYELNENNLIFLN